MSFFLLQEHHIMNSEKIWEKRSYASISSFATARNALIPPEFAMTLNIPYDISSDKHCTYAHHVMLTAPSKKLTASVRALESGRSFSASFIVRICQSWLDRDRAMQ